MAIRWVAVIANGAEPVTPGERTAMAVCAACVCCDRLPPPGAPPLLQVVGDLDSLGACALPPAMVTDLHADQETNDLAKAQAWLRVHEPAAQLAYFGVTGLREDHTLGNLALIAAGPAPARVLTASGRFELLPAGHHEVKVAAQHPVSFLSFVPQRVTVRGVVWPVERLLLDTLWRATLNRTLADSLVVDCEAPLFLFQPWRS